MLKEDVLRSGDELIITEIDRLGRDKAGTLKELQSGHGAPKITEVYGKDAFTYRENSIVVTIPFTRICGQKVGNKVGNDVGNKKPLNARRKKIIAEMRDNPNVTTAELHIDMLCRRHCVISNKRSFGYDLS